MKFDLLFSSAAKRLQPSIIRKLLALVQKGGVISLAGGTPDARLFPIKILDQLSHRVMSEQGDLALQYGETAGWRPLREQLAIYLKNRGIQCGPQNILITNGSQQGIDLLARIFIDEGDTVAVESPSYLGGLLVFKNYGAEYVTLRTSSTGLDIAACAKALDAAVKKPKFVYLVPTYQNPSGYTMTEPQREQLCQLARQRDLLLIEDDPYGELSFDEEPIRPLKAFDTDGRVAYLGSFSKIGVPGFRLGWTCADEALIEKMVLAKETATVCANVFSQAIAAEYFKGGHLTGQLKRVRGVYKSRRDAMLKALKEKLPSQISFNSPSGGFFVWLKGPENLDTTVLFESAIEAGVAYVPGATFYTKPNEGKNTLRLTFAAVDEAAIIEGVSRLAKILHHALKASPV